MFVVLLCQVVDAIQTAKDVDTIKNLVAAEGAKPNVNHCNKDGSTLLHFAIRYARLVRGVPTRVLWNDYNVEIHDVGRVIVDT